MILIKLENKFVHLQESPHGTTNTQDINQKRVMPPYSSELIIADGTITHHSERISDFTLLFYGEKDIRLDAEHKGRDA